ncbi:hypothetical protein ACQP2K_17485 [Microbispora siamensis]
MDVGPHPNQSKAADGKRPRRLEPDPATAPIVGRIFWKFLHGQGLYLIAEGLTKEGIPMPLRLRPGQEPPPQRDRLVEVGEADRVAIETAKRTIDDCDRRMARYRTTLDAGGDPQAMARSTGGRQRR